MIEYLLLFSLGFITAVLAGLLVAPAIGRRIIHFTEKRIRATVPISTQELRARTDMIKAAYAAENARLGHDVRHAREKGVASETRAERLQAELSRQRDENDKLSERVRALQDENEALGQKLHENHAELMAAQALVELKQAELDTREKQLGELTMEAVHLGGLIDTGKIDLVTRETELENLRTSVSMLRGERDKLRDEVRNAEDRARQAEFKLERDHGKIVDLRERLERELALNADHEEAIERRASELEKLREGLSAFGVPDEGTPVDEAERNSAKTDNPPDEEPAIMIDQQRMADGIRHDAAAVSDALVNEAGPDTDERLREEIASIAARMVALTALREGETSPLLSLIEERGEDRGHGRISLAERAARVLSGKDI